MTRKRPGVLAVLLPATLAVAVLGSTETPTTTSVPGKAPGYTSPVSSSGKASAYIAVAHRSHRAARHHARHRAMAHTCTPQRWRASLYAQERWIDMRESGLNPRSRNHRSGAHGLGQLLPRTYRHVGVPVDYNPCHQITAQRRYMAHRYRYWNRAVAFWRHHHWW